MPFRHFLWGLLLAASLSHCSRNDERDAPLSALLAFMSAIERSIGEPDYREQAYRYVDAHSRQVLDERAALARSLAGREMQGWEMLVPGRLSVTSRDLRREHPRAEIDGDHARITLGEGESIDLVREEGQWRLRLFEEATATEP